MMNGLVKCDVCSCGINECTNVTVIIFSIQIYPFLRKIVMHINIIEANYGASLALLRLMVTLINKISIFYHV